jgi:hypothetical protein
VFFIKKSILINGWYNFKGEIRMPTKKVISRAEKAGMQTATAIVEMIHLMYQNNTACNFWKGLMSVLEQHRRDKKGV